VILQTADQSIVNAAQTNINIFIDQSGGGVNLVVPGPAAGLYTPDEWATALTDVLTEAVAGVYTEHITAAVNTYDPLTFNWSTGFVNPETGFQAIVFEDPLDTQLGFTNNNRTIYAQAAGVFNPTVCSIPNPTTYVDHTFTVPEANYTIDELIVALNALTAADPGLLDPMWSLTADNKISVVHTAGHDYPRLKVLSVIENRSSTLAPLLGFQGYNKSFGFDVLADTPPGLHGLLNAYCHIRPLATSQTVTVSAADSQALQVSVMGIIPTVGVQYGQFTQTDFSGSGDTFTLEYSDDRDVTRFQCRLRDHQGRLLELTHPGVTLFLKLWTR
jgi:hypothetical protein